MTYLILGLKSSPHLCTHLHLWFICQFLIIIRPDLMVDSAHIRLVDTTGPTILLKPHHVAKQLAAP